MSQAAQNVLDKYDLTTARTFEEYGRVGLSNIKRAFDTNTNMRPIQDLEDEVAACIASVDVVKRNLTSGDGKTDITYRLKFWDKPRGPGSRLCRPR